MRKGKLIDKIGVWAFVGGLVIALIAAIFMPGGLGPGLVWFLGALGVVVGLVNVIDEEVQLYLLASIAFIVGAGSLADITDRIILIGRFFPTFFEAVIVFVAPGAAVVALRALYDIAKD